jgi:3-keto steroid reductase
VRSQAKAADTKARLDAYTASLAAGKASVDLVPKPEGAKWDHTTTSLDGRAQWARRVSVEPVAFDLCSLTQIHKAGNELKARYKRIDVVVCNAGIGGWTGLSWMGLIKQFFTEGILAALGAPNYKIGKVGALTERQIIPLDEKDKKETAQDDLENIGEVFCANVFGHYVFVKALLPLLYRKDGEGDPGRVIWVSTLEAYAKYFDDMDIQGFKSHNAYESSKRLTDVLVLSAGDGENVWAKEYLALPPTTNGSATDTPKRRSTRVVAKDAGVPPKMYLTHPGICVTAILPIHIILIYFQIGCFYLVRWLGSQWHNVEREKGVTATTWLILENGQKLDEMKAETVKWGSGVNRSGHERVLETNVEERDEKSFDKLGEKCWMEMEELRSQWDERLGKAGLLN